MQQTVDSRIQARVRLLMSRKWVDLNSLTIGTTNGVVYLGGGLRIAKERDVQPGQAQGGKSWLGKLRHELCAIPEVNDVVFQFHELEEVSDS